MSISCCNRWIFTSMIWFISQESMLYARDSFILPVADSAVVFDEIPVHVFAEGVGDFYIDALYSRENLLFINIQELFKTLKIQCIAGLSGDSVGGFIGAESRKYSIDFNQSRIAIGGKIVQADGKLLMEAGSGYMESGLFSELFGISLVFNYRALTMMVKPDFELPVVRQMRLERLQANLSGLKGEVMADTVINRNYHLFRPGSVDWSVTSFQTWKGLAGNQLRMGLGTELLFGEATVSLDFSDQYKFDSRQVQYLWRWVDNNSRFIRQAQAGRIQTRTIAFINSPVIGAVIRNSPATVRKAKGYHTINEVTEPNWTVELYINNVLVDYTRADASGLFMFKVPVVYGFTTLTLRFYGPMGEERTEERTMNVPYSVMPAGEFEYGLSGGFLQDSVSSRFGKSEFNYGVNRFVTVGGGLEYLSSISSGPFIPYATATIQPSGNLLLNAEYAHGVKTRLLLDYYFAKSALLEIDYSKFAEGQRATRFNAPEERKVKLSVPFRVSRISGFARMDYRQLVYQDFSNSIANLMVSAYYRQFSINSSAQLNWIDANRPYSTADLAVSWRLGDGFIFRPSARCNITERKLITLKAEIEKRISRGYFTVSYEWNALFNDSFIHLNLNYDLSFARTNISVSRSRNLVLTSENAQGSIAFGGGTRYVHASNNSAGGKGGICIYPYLDLNRNGIFDQGERLVNLSSVHIDGGKPVFHARDSIIRVPDLNSFVNYTLEFADKDLEDISWRFRNKVYSILIDPNQFKRVDVPVEVVGMVSGMAWLEKNDERKGLGKIRIKFYRKNGTEAIGETMSEPDGYLEYMGLAAGDYVACVDTVQLNNLNYTVDPVCRSFTVKISEQGDTVGGLDFILRPAQQSKIIDNKIVK